MRLSALVIMLSTLAASCADSPAQPDSGSPSFVPPPSLSVSVEEATVARGATQQLSASLRSGTASSDVTALATWTSSNESVVRVDGGVLTGASPGSARVTVRYQNLEASASVVVRRNFAILGNLKLIDVVQYPGVSGILLRFDGQEISYRGSSDYCAPSSTIPFPDVHVARTGSVGLDPGHHTFQAEFLTPDFMDSGCPQPGHVARADDTSYYRIIDSDTRETVTQVSLAGVEAIGGRPVRPLLIEIDIDNAGHSSISSFHQ